MNPSDARIPATPEFVLDVIRDTHRHQCAFDPEADPSALLTFESTVADWRAACDLVDTDELGSAMNEIWAVTIPSAVWRSTLAPASSRTLRDVCNLLASHADRADLRPAGFLGASCTAAGAFLAVRTLLLRAGASPSSIKPSAPIAEATRTFPHVFLGPISRLSPGRLPTVAIRTPLYTRASAAFLVGLLGAIGLSRSYPELAFAAALIAGGSWAVTWLAAQYVRPSEVRFGGIVTFRDLAQVIAGGPAA